MKKKKQKDYGLACPRCKRKPKKQKSKRKSHSDLCGYPYSPCSCIRGKKYKFTLQSQKELEKAYPWLDMTVHGMQFPRKHYFRGLRELDIDNLKAGRITRQTMGVAFKRANEALKQNPYHDIDLLIADELNDMLEAAR